MVGPGGVFAGGDSDGGRDDYLGVGRKAVTVGVLSNERAKISVAATRQRPATDTPSWRLAMLEQSIPERLIPRFWAKVDKAGSGGCWLWTADKLPTGYGRFSINTGGKTVKLLAHRVAYEWATGPIPDGLELDHLCRTRNCVNPAHLEPVSHRTNTRRGVGPTALNAQRDVCLRGHPFDTADALGARRCSVCQKARSSAASARYRAKQRGQQ